MEDTRTTPVLDLPQAVTAQQTRWRLLAAVVVAAVALALLYNRVLVTPGTLVNSYQAVGMSEPLPPGAVMTFVVAQIENRGRHGSGTLTSVKPRGVRGNIRILGVELGDPRDGYVAAWGFPPVHEPGGAPSFPLVPEEITDNWPRYHTESVYGHKIPPKDGSRILVALTVADGAEGSLAGVDVRYSQDGRSHVIRVAVFVHVCSVTTDIEHFGNATCSANDST